MSEQTVHTFTLECEGRCGREISYTTPDKLEDVTDAIAEGAGWSTVDLTKTDVGVYCQACIRAARRLVKQLGMADEK